MRNNDVMCILLVLMWTNKKNTIKKFEYKVQFATSLQDCRNSKFVIFQEKNLKVYKSHKLNRITHLELNRITQ